MRKTAFSQNAPKVNIDAETRNVFRFIKGVTLYKIVLLDLMNLAVIGTPTASKVKVTPLLTC